MRNPERCLTTLERSPGFASDNDSLAFSLLCFFRLEFFFPWCESVSLVPGLTGLVCSGGSRTNLKNVQTKTKKKQRKKANPRPSFNEIHAKD